jgi:hypothetical protein
MGMSRQRSIPPDIFTDETLIGLPIETKWTAIGLRLQADDQGRESANTALLRASIWPLTSSITEDTLIDHLLDLDRVGYIAVYSAGERTCYAVLDWPAVSHPQESRFPAPPVLQRDSSGPLETFSAGERESGGEGESAEGGGARPAGFPPDPFCPVHPRGVFADCRNCGTARLYARKWEREQRMTLGSEAE